MRNQVEFCIAAVIAWQSVRSKAAALAAVLMLPLIAWGGYAITRPALHVAARAPVAFGAVPPSPYAPPLSRLSQPQGPFQQTGHMADSTVDTVTGLGQAVDTIRPTPADKEEYRRFITQQCRVMTQLDPRYVPNICKQFFSYTERK